MAAAFSISGRMVRAGVILLLGWLLLEIALLQLVAARIGWGATLAFLSIKGGAGLILVGYMTLRGFSKLKSMARRKPDAPDPGITGLGTVSGLGAVFGVISGILITLPGLIPPLLGIVLLSPSVQGGLLRRFSGAGKRAGRATSPPREIDLESGEWREIRRKKLATRARSRKASLEAGPPSV